MSEGRYRTRPIAHADPSSGLRSGVRALDDYFRRHAVANDQDGVGRAYVLPASSEDLEAGLPDVLGFYTLSMASIGSPEVSSLLATSLPRYPMPVGLIGRLAVDERARGRRIGETLLLDALARVIEASRLIACLGVIVDAKDAPAAGFYAKYGFTSLDDSTTPRRMFLSMHVARAAFDQ